MHDPSPPPTNTSPPDAPTRKIHPIARFAVERRVTMAMIVVGILVLGWISLARLPLEFLPAFSSSSVSVSVDFPSSSPEEIERLIVRPLEDSLGTINGVETLSASARSGGAELRIELIDGTDMDLAVVEVRDRIDRVRHLLPDEVERVRIRRWQSTDIPILSFHLSADWPDERFYDFAETVIQRRLERLPGVAQASIRGLRVPEVQVRLDPARLEAHGLDVRTVVGLLRASNVNLSAGNLRQGTRKFLVRTVGELRTLDEIRRLPLAGSLRLEDVAEVLYTFPEQENFNFLNGTSALTARINKASTANLLEVVDAVKAELAEIQALPEAEGLEVRIYHDASIDVREGIDQLRQAGLVGAILAVLAVYFFLRRFRTTLLIAVAIPISIVFTFVILFLLRQAGVLDTTLNVISLTGLMLALGMLVDNSVVVIESIFRHKNEKGEDAKTAALVGTSEVALPIIASTATTLCVFLPLVFLASMGGRFAMYMKDIGITISIVSVAALLMALTVVPMVAALLLSNQEARPSNLFAWMTGSYGAVLRFTLRHRPIFVLSILAMLWGSWALLSSIERSFSSGSVERQITLNVETPRQYSLDETRALYDELFRLVDTKREEFGIADIVYGFDRTSSSSPFGRSNRFEIYLLDEEQSPMSTTEVQNKLRELLPTKAGVELKIAQSQHRGGGGGITLEIMGDDLSVLTLLAEQITGRLRGVTAIRDVDTSLEDGDEEIHVQVERSRALQAGLSTQAVAFTVQGALSSRPVSYFKTPSRELDLVMQYAEEDRETLDQLKKVPVFRGGGSPGGGATLPLGAVAGFEMKPGPQAIERENRMSKVSITANTTDSKAMFGAMREVGAIMASFPMPPGYSWSYGRWTRWQTQDDASSTFALLFALGLIYMLMAALFESFAHPFTIMLSVPFAFLGVGVVLKLVNQPLDTMVLIGLIILVGVVVNNAIVLVDHINQLRGEGMPILDAIVQGGQHRLRPILITAVTTILGLTPMVGPFFLPQIFGSLEGRAATWAPVGLVIVGGLATSTFLTLMIIPTIYSVVDDISRFLRRAVTA